MSGKKIVCFWEGDQPADYLLMAVTSWLNFVDAQDIVVLNHSNVEKYIGEFVTVEQLSKYPLAQQSDIVSAYYLAKYGGCFLDVDTIFTSERALRFLELKPGKLSAFGRTGSGYIHLGALACEAGQDAVKHWSGQLDERVPRFEDYDKWNYVGNAILDPYLCSADNKSKLQVFDVVKEHLTPEVSLKSEVGLASEDRRFHLYRDFWMGFHENHEDVLNRIETDGGGIISLHNSWTPLIFEVLDMDDLKADERLLSRALRRWGDATKFDQVVELLATK